MAVTDLTERERTLFRRRNLGIVFQAFNLIPTLDGAGKRDAARGAGRQRRGQGSRRHICWNASACRTGCATFPDRLSGGEQQRVAIARSLIHEPLLILADEPTGNLDEDTGAAVLDLLLELTRDAGKTLIMATHATEIAQYADRVLHLDHGHLVSDRLWQEQHAVDGRRQAANGRIAAGLKTQ